MQKEGLNGLDSASLRRVTGLVSKSESKLSLDNDAYHIIRSFVYLSMSSQMLEQTFKVLDDFTWVELRMTKM